MADPKAPKVVPVFTSAGELAEVPEDKYEQAMQYGGIRPASEAEVKEYFARKQAAEQPIRAAAEGAARSLTFGASDYIAQQAGVPQEDLRLRREENPTASTLGEVGGDIASLVVPGGSVLKAAKALKAGKVATLASEAARGAISANKGISKAGQAAVRAIEKAGEGSTRGLAKLVTSKPAARAVGSAVEGAIYGARQAVTEDALGNTDLTAESLLHDMGMGAMFGGAAGAGAEVLGAGLRGLGSTAKAAAGKFFKLGEDTAEDMAAKTAYSGLKPKKADILSTTPKEREEIGRYMLDTKLATGASTVDDVAREVEKRADDVGSRIKQVYADLDNAPIAKPDANSIYSKIEAEVIAPLKADPFKQKIARRVESELAGFKRLHVRPDLARAEMTYNELWDRRKSLDDIIDFSKDMDPGVHQELSRVRGIINNTLQTPEGAGLALSAELKKLNSEYKKIAFIREKARAITAAEEAAKGRIGLQDMISAGAGATAGAVLGGGPGAVLGGAAAGALRRAWNERGAFVTASMLDDISKLGKLERQQNSLVNSVKDAVDGFFSGARKAIVPTSVDTTYGYIRTAGDKKESRRDAAIRRIDEVREMVASPDAVMEQMAEKTRNLSEVAPNTAFALQQTALRGAQFLNERLPRDPGMGDSITPLVPTNWKPTGQEIARAMRYIRAIENPGAVIKDVKNGQVDVDTMDALKAVYPNIHNEIVNAIMMRAANHKKPLSYEQKVQLSIITGVPIDYSMRPESIKTLQKNMAVVAAQRAQRNSGGNGVPSMASSSSTLGQKIGWSR